MAWLRGRVALGSFPDLAGAVNKISESVKNIEKNFDNALGLEDQPGGSTSTVDASNSWSPEFMAFVGQKDGNGTADTSSKKLESSEKHDLLEKHDDSSQKHDKRSSEEHDCSERHKSSNDSSTEEHFPSVTDASVRTTKPEEHQGHPVEKYIAITEKADSSSENPLYTNTVIQDQADSIVEYPEEAENITEKPVQTNLVSSDEATDIVDNHIEVEADSQTKPNADDSEEPENRENSKIGSTRNSDSVNNELVNCVDQLATTSLELNEVHVAPEKSDHEPNIQDKLTRQEASTTESEPHRCQSSATESVEEGQPHLLQSPDDDFKMVRDVVPKDDNENAKVHTVNQLSGDDQRDQKGQQMSLRSNSSDDADSMVELETLKNEMKKMEAALLGAARQARAKADEIANLLNENEQLKSTIVDQRRKSHAEIESLGEEYHQRVSTLERKVYALTRERDALRREQNKRSDATVLLKKKDEIITQVMAEGEELSKKQAVQESTIRKLRAQIREFEEEKKGLISKLQIEENKVESLKREKASTEKLLQETIEKNQAELATQKENYMNALSAAKEANALAEARANDEARNELESHLREAEERETMLVQTLEELRHTLSIKEQQAVCKEDMLRKDIDDLQKRYQASERRCEELVMQLPESTRPLLRQIESMQETAARKAEAWATAERSLNIRLQDADAKAEAAEERDRSVNERLSQTLSRINVLEAQISCLRTEQTQLTRSLEKERQRASESRQEFLALKEEADTHKGCANQLKEAMTELKRKHKQEMQEAMTQRELLRQDIDREKDARLKLEKTARLQDSIVCGQSSIAKTKSVSENGLTRRLSSGSSISSMEESFFLQASLDSSHNFSERNPKEPPVSPYYLKSMTPSAFQAALRQKEGELASYMSRLASMEAIRDSLSVELVKMTEDCEKLRSEVALLPSIKAELEALRVRHSTALELMGERDEELEELRADIVDLKEMYREQVNMLVNKIQKGSSVDVTRGGDVT